MAANILPVVEEKEMRHLPQKQPLIKEERAENHPVPLGQRKELICSKAGG